MSAAMSTPAIKTRVSAVPLFSGLSSPELDRLAAGSRSLTFRRGARIFEEGSVADCCYLMVDGRAKVVLDSEDGSEVLLGDVAPGDLVGEVALLDGFPRSAALVATLPSLFVVIPAAVFHSLRSNLAFERGVVAHVMAILRHSTEHVRRVSSGPSITRVAWCLGHIATREGKREGRLMIIPKKPHHELAGMVGCTRETVSRALSALKRKKFVSWDAQSMRLEMEGLQRYIRSQQLIGR